MEFKATNTNKKIKINSATFAEASQLKKEVMKCLSQTNVLKEIDFTNFSTIDVNKIFNAISELVISIDSSSDFEEALFNCLGRCTCDNIAISKQLFDDVPELREDYYEIITKCCEENLRPFFKSLSSELTKRLQVPSLNTQQQK